VQVKSNSFVCQQNIDTLSKAVKKEMLDLLDQVSASLFCDF